MEIWKDIPNYEGLYQASNYGRIRSLDRVRKYKSSNQYGDYVMIQNIKGRILKPIDIGKGYYRVTLSKKPFFIHRIVWVTFNGRIPEGYEINHIDENPSNNRLDNLELVTHKENMNWGTRNQRVSKKMTNGKLSKPVSQYDLNGKLIATFPSSMEIQRLFNYNHSNIEKCCNHIKHYNTAYGYKWEYN